MQSRHFAVIITLLNAVIYCQEPERETEYGKIRGSISQKAVVPVEQYLGVPYARPPVGDLRFERPEEPVPWENTLNTVDLPPACLQGRDIGYVLDHRPNFNKSHQGEDCLYLNIYVPKVSTTTSLPTLFYIHGGSNRAGMGAMFDGDILAGYGEMIVVTFNYRLGLLGYLANKDYKLDGNYGLLDQLFALKWVNRNIRSFGGDPSRITVQGHSAGAGNVGLLAVSPLAKGLFQYVIVHSGSPLSFWNLPDPKAGPGFNFEFKDRDWKGQENRTSLPLKSALKRLSSDAIMELWVQFVKRMPFNVVHLTPVIDDYFLTGTPDYMYSTGKFHGNSFLLAFTDDEQLSTPNSIKDLTGYARFFPSICDFEETIETEYNEEIPRSQRYIKAEADMVFFSPMIQLANYVSEEKNKTYIFDYAYFKESSRDWSKGWSKAIRHGVDLFYLFGAPITGHSAYKFDEVDVNVSKTVMKLWGNFVKMGFLSIDGVVELNSYNKRTMLYHKLFQDGDSLNLTEHADFRGDKMTFWNDIVPNMTCNSGQSYLTNVCDSNEISIFSIILYIIHTIITQY